MTETTTPSTTPNPPIASRRPVERTHHGDTFIDDDFAFATRDGLILALEKNTPPRGYESLGITAPFTRSRFDFVMQPAVDASESSPTSRVARAIG